MNSAIMMISDQRIWAMMCVVGVATMLTRFLPFFLFPANKATPPYIAYLGKVLPYASIAMIVVYALKGTQLLVLSSVAPTAIAVAAIVVLHRWKKSSLISIGGGTLLYMLLVQFVFV